MMVQKFEEVRCVAFSDLSGNSKNGDKDLVNMTDIISKNIAVGSTAASSLCLFGATAII